MEYPKLCWRCKNITKKIWDLIAVFVSVLFSIILWFTYLGSEAYTINNVVNTGLIWIVGVAIIGLGAKMLGWILELFDVIGDAEVLKLKAAK